MIFMWTIEGGIIGLPKMLLEWLAIANVNDAEVPNIEEGGEGRMWVGVRGMQYDS